MKKILFTIATLCLCTISSLAQESTYFRDYTIEPDEDYENVHVIKLSEDSLMSTFLIWVKNHVPLHKHEFHTENVFVLNGSGTMKIGEEEKEIKVGDMVFIPKNTKHSVTVTSESPLKVISVQSPIFLGKDRIFIEE